MRVFLEPISDTATSNDSIARKRRLIVLVIWIVVGSMIPLWFSLTQVYRAPLPFQEISNLKEMRLSYGLEIYLDFGSQAEMALGGSNEKTKAMNRIQNELFFAEKNPDHRLQLAVSIHDLKTAKSNIVLIRKPGAYTFKVECLKDASKNTVLIIEDRRVELKVLDCSPDGIISFIVKAASTLFLSEYYTLSHLYSQGAKRDISVLQYSPEYQVIFSLLVSNPNDATVSWDIQNAINALNPLLNRFSNITKFIISSQTQNYASLPLIPEKTLINGLESFVLVPKDLTHFINSAEWNLASAVSSSPAINFVLYIPPKETSPLQILHTDGTPLKTNAFLIPQWGGIVVKNIPFSTAQLSHHAHLGEESLHPIMEIYAQQLRLLMGVEGTFLHNREHYLPSSSVDINIRRESSNHLGLTDWELDRALKRTIIQNIMDTTSTLNSLTSLLKSLESIIVKDYIRELIDESMHSISSATTALQQVNYNLSSKSARNAIVLAEKAFFHPEMVALLYFPAEHLLAIYMPFFVPIAVPMISAAVRELKIWRATRGMKIKID